MGYSLTAILLDRAASQLPRPLQGVQLTQGITLLPLTDEVIDRLPGTGKATQHGFWKLNAAIESVIQELSWTGRVAFVEVDFFGGTGSQTAAVWQSGKVILGPVHTNGRGAVNEALRCLGVEKGAAVDEFDALNLSYSRSTEDWLDEDS